MARIHRVKKSRKEYTCRACGGVIEVGKPYQWFKSFRRPKSYYHDFCRIPESHRTGSDKLSRLYAAREVLEGLLAEDPSGLTLEEIQDALDEALEEAEAVMEEYEDSKAAIEEYFSDSDTAYDIQDKIDAILEWTLAIQAAVPDEGDSVEEALEQVEQACGELEL